MTISKITIENIRGFESNSLDVNLRPNTANIVVAPNGFGKSSISTAFKCATGSTLIVATSDKFKNEDVRVSRFEIRADGIILEATAGKNEISDWASISVIKSSIEPKAKLPRVNGFPVAKPYMEIPSLDLGVAPKKEKLSYDFQKVKIEYSPIAKVAPNLSKLLEAPAIRATLLDAMPEIDRLKQVAPTKMLDEAMAFVKGQNGTRSEIEEALEANLREKIESIECIKLLLEVMLAAKTDIGWSAAVLLCGQLRQLCVLDRKNLKKWLQRGEFEYRVQWAKEFISDINAGWVAAEVKETKGRLLVNFPDATSLSNGQRDLLFFATSLIRASNADVTATAIIVIDEVFDYLDDSNLIVAQYFLSRLIDRFRKNNGKLYLVILTHLDPAFFKGYALRRQNITYLGTANQVVTETMRKIIIERENPVWASEVPQYFLHFHPENYDLSEVFNINFGLPKLHGKSFEFYKFLRLHWEKLEAGEDDYDPFAVCAFVRVEIERRIYRDLNSQDMREEFLATKGTANKIVYAEGMGVEVPEVCLLLGILYNDAMHKKGAIDQRSNIALKVKNIALRRMMRSAVDW